MLKVTPYFITVACTLFNRPTLSFEISLIYSSVTYLILASHQVSFFTIYSKFSPILYNTIPYNTIPYNTIPYHTIPYNTIQYNFSDALPFFAYLQQLSVPGYLVVASTGLSIATSSLFVASLYALSNLLLY
jgi:hypothetical protein